MTKRVTAAKQQEYDEERIKPTIIRRRPKKNSPVTQDLQECPKTTLSFKETVKNQITSFQKRKSTTPTLETLFN